MTDLKQVAREYVKNRHFVEGMEHIAVNKDIHAIPIGKPFNYTPDIIRPVFNDIYVNFYTDSDLECLLSRSYWEFFSFDELTEQSETDIRITESNVENFLVAATRQYRHNHDIDGSGEFTFAYDMDDIKWLVKTLLSKQFSAELRDACKAYEEAKDLMILQSVEITEEHERMIAALAAQVILKALFQYRKHTEVSDVL